MITPRITDRIAADYSTDEDRAAARALIDLIPEELSFWREVTKTDRVEAAALTLAGGDLDKLRSAVELALSDWRDLLVAAGHG